VGDVDGPPRGDDENLRHGTSAVSIHPGQELSVSPTRVVEHPTPEDRAARGRTARAAVPRSSHGAWSPTSDRPDPVDLLLQQATTRVPELVPIRHARMLASPFAFYRGAAAVMATDLANTPSSGIRVQVCGDAHLANFGGFAAPDRTLVFDVNDFDETLPGPWEWDVKRLAASFDIAARSREFDDKVRGRIVRETVRSYREAMREYAGTRNLDLWYLRLDEATVFEKWQSRIAPAAMKRYQKNVAKARTRDSLGAFAKLTGTVDGRVRIISNPPLVVPLDELMPEVAASELRDQLHVWFRGYRRTLQPDRRQILESFELVDFARKVVGVGSVGTRSWIALLLGRDGGDPLFLQIKEAEASVLEEHVGKAAYGHHGRRVVEGQRMMQSASDIFLGWDRATGVDGLARDFYVRQLWDGKMSADVDSMAPEALSIYGEMCGSTLARAHARSGDRIAIASYLGNGDIFDRAIAEFATAYADQNQRDFDAVAVAAKSGVIAVDEREAAAR
jgi:uncharacterized protein (DUF2252 family)